MRPLILELRREHGAIIQALGRLSAGLDQLRLGINIDYPGLLAVLEELTEQPDQVHHPKEELIFDRICVRCDSVPPLINRLREEHSSLVEMGRRLADRLARARKTNHLNPSVILAQAHDYIQGQRWHIAREETGLYRLAESTLSDKDWQELEQLVQQRFPEQSTSEPASLV
jgi:hemerythrin-like domain-containing protein